MGKLLAAFVKYILTHPEVITEVAGVVDAVKAAKK
jgi:hypothetical protein